MCADIVHVVVVHVYSSLACKATIDKGGLFGAFRNVCFTIANCRDSFFSVFNDTNGLKNGGLWHGFRNICFVIANCRGSFFPEIKADVNDEITKRKPVQDDRIIAQSGFSWLKV